MKGIVSEECEEEEVKKDEKRPKKKRKKNMTVREELTICMELLEPMMEQIMKGNDDEDVIDNDEEGADDREDTDDEEMVDEIADGSQGDLIDGDDM